MSFHSLVFRPFTSQQPHPQQSLRRLTLMHKLCHECLHRSTAAPTFGRPAAATAAATAARRSLTTTATVYRNTRTRTGAASTMAIAKTRQSQSLPVQKGPLTILNAMRQDLYRPASVVSSNEQPSSIIRKSIERREHRKRLLKFYYLLSRRASATRTADKDMSLAHITHRDIEFFLSKFTSINPDEPANQHHVNRALSILEDMKAGVFPQAPFRWQKDGETMICLAAELNKAARADELLTEWIDVRRKSQTYDTISMGVYEAVIGSLSRRKQLDRVYHWLNQMRQQQERVDLSTSMLSRRIIRYVAMCHLSLDQLDEAVSFLKMHQRNHPWIRDEVFGNIRHNYSSQNKHSSSSSISHSSRSDNLLAIDEALGLFAKDCDVEWRLNEMRQIYLTKRRYNLSRSHVIVRALSDKCIYTRQSYTVLRLLRDTVRVKDTKGAQICARKLIQWHLAEDNVPLAIEVYEKLHKNQIHLPSGIFHKLVIEAAKKKYPIEALRMYKECKKIYPTQAFLTAFKTQAKTNLTPAHFREFELLREVVIDTPVSVFRGLIRARDYTRANELCAELLPLIPVAPREICQQLVRSLYSFCTHTSNLGLFEKVFKHNEELKLELTHEGLTSLFALYLKREDVASAKWAFRQIATLTEGPDIYDFNLLLRTIKLEDDQRLRAGIADDGSSQNKILDILQHMQRVNLAPDPSTLRTLVTLTKDQKMRTTLFQRLFELSEQNQSASNATASIQRHQNRHANSIFLNNLVLDNILETKGLKEAADILIKNDRGALFPQERGKPIQHDSITFYTFFSACLSRPLLKPHQVTPETMQPLLIARKLLNIVRSRGPTPHVFVYHKLIQHYAAIGKIGQAYNFLKWMEKDYEGLVSLKARHYLPIVDALLRQNKFILARRLIVKEMKKEKKIPLDVRLRNRLKLITEKMK